MMDKTGNKEKRLKRIKSRIRGTKVRPRLVVFRSNRHMYAQLIDDAAGKTLAAASDTAIKGTKTSLAAEVGKVLADAAIKLKIKRVVFDRRVYKFHGRVKAVATAAREGGLKF